jgi:hypothetical protein
MKVIEFNSPDGVYQIPLMAVAKDRAGYYSSEGEDEFCEEVDFVMEDDFEGIDWLLNNSNFEDWADHIIRISDKPCVSVDDFWCDSSYFEIKEIPERRDSKHD